MCPIVLVATVHFPESVYLSVPRLSAHFCLAVSQGGVRGLEAISVFYGEGK